MNPVNNKKYVQSAQGGSGASAAAPVVALERPMIAVASNTDQMPHVSKLTLSIVDPVSSRIFYNEKELAAEDLCSLLQQGKTVTDISYVQVRIPIKGAAALTNAEYAASIITHTQGGWRPSSYQDGAYYIWLFSPQNTIEIPKYQALTIVFDQIVSYEAAGICEIEVILFLLAEDLHYSFSIQKQQMLPSIASFYPAPHSVTAGQNTKLFWTAYDFSGGCILPLAVSFKGDTGSYIWQPDAPMCVQLQVYQQDALQHTAAADCCRIAPVYVRPPQFRQLKLEGDKTSRKVIWDAAFAQTITCDGETVKAKDEKQLPSDRTKVCFHADGYLFQRDETLYFPDYHQLVLLKKTELHFKAYAILQLRWEFREVDQIRLRVFVSNDDRQVLNLEAKGTWEYPVLNYQKIQLEAIKNSAVLFSILLS